jgi:hypothetical protein
MILTTDVLITDMSRRRKTLALLPCLPGGMAEPMALTVNGD